MSSLLLLSGLCFALCIALALGVQSVGPSEYRRRLQQFLGPWAGVTQITFTGNTTATNTITVTANLDNMRVGMTVVGGGFPADTTVTAINFTTSVATLSNPTGATATGVVFTAGGGLANAKCHLFAAPFTGGNDPTPASFTEATFDLYSAKLVSGTSVYSNPDGSSESDFGDLAWVLLATPTTGNIIYGYWIDYIDPFDGTTVVVSTWESFPSPINMNAVGNAVVISVPLTMPLPASVSVP